MFWVNSWRDLNDKVAVEEAELKQIYRKYDMNNDFHHVIGRTGTPFTDMITKSENSRILL